MWRPASEACLIVFHTVGAYRSNRTDNGARGVMHGLRAHAAICIPFTVRVPRRAARQTSPRSPASPRPRSGRAQSSECSGSLGDRRRPGAFRYPPSRPRRCQPEPSLGLRSAARPRGRGRTRRPRSRRRPGAESRGSAPRSLRWTRSRAAGRVERAALCTHRSVRARRFALPEFDSSRSSWDRE